MNTLTPAERHSPITNNQQPTTPPNLIDELLAEQRNLTAAERFAQHHADATSPTQAKHYRDLIPLTAPGPGEQYAFEVDLDKCTGCKACVSACHSLNGLEENETWRDVGMLLGEAEGIAYQQTVTTACHHCADPACANGCPVLAYEKDEITGIVRHLDDQCIGCQYCSLKCPYDVPKYSKKKGIVRKCDMCHSRLAVGEAPACVQACPTEAIQIVSVQSPKSKVEGQLLPGVITSSYTQPTTRYVTKKIIPSSASRADARRPRLEHSHLPLVIMLTLTQAAVGLVLAATISSASFPLTLSPTLNFKLSTLNCAALAALMTGLTASVLHLGQPLKAWRVFLGLRRSWLSREVVAFGALPPLVAGAVIFPRLIGIPAALYGILCVFTSVMVYADTQRELWRFPRTAFRFYGTVALFATAAVAACYPIALLILGAKLLAEARFRAKAAPADPSHDSLSAQLLRGPLRRQVLLRNATAVLGAVLLPFLPVVGMAILVLSEGIERHQFFTTVVAHRMPGGA